MRTRAAVLFGFMIAAACSGGDDSPPAPPPPVTGAMALYNGTSYVIHEAYASPAAASTWGAQRNGSPIPPGYTLTVTGLAPGLWHAAAVSIGTTSIFFAYAWDLPVTAGETLTLGAVNSDFSGSLRVANGSVYAITAIYFTPSSSSTWGVNQLSAPLSYGSTFHLYDVTPGAYDLRCDHSNGGTSTGTYSIASFGVTNVTCY